MELYDREWKEFNVEELFDNIFNSVAYHKTQLIPSDDKSNSILYITRTNKNNGLEDIVKKMEDLKINPGNIIVFGAENATFFYQPLEHITGNKMYGISHKDFNKYTGLFIQQVLNKSIQNCGFGYGQGLTATRQRRRSVMLPVLKDDTSTPDWNFMEEYIEEIYCRQKEVYKKYISEVTRELEYIELEPLENREWKEFFITDIFTEIQRGKRLTRDNQVKGNIPYVSSTALNNGVDNYISNNTNVRKFSNCITIANSGSVGASFYHPYEFIASDHVTHLKNDTMNKYIYLFIATITNRLSGKYNFNREINDKRISREKIVLPVNQNNQPDYQYMEQYIKNIMAVKYKHNNIY